MLLTPPKNVRRAEIKPDGLNWEGIKVFQLAILSIVNTHKGGKTNRLLISRRNCKIIITIIKFFLSVMLSQ